MRKLLCHICDEKPAAWKGGPCKACYSWFRDKQRRTTGSLMNYFHKIDRTNARIERFRSGRRRKSA